MAYTRINWLRRIREFANRIKLTLVSGTTYDVEQIEGVVSQIGVPFSDTDMNKMDFALYLSHNTFVNTSGTDAYAINVVGLTSLTELIGIPLKFVTTVANTGACSLNVTGLGSASIAKDVTAALETGDILANSIVMVVYDGTRYQLMEMCGIVTKNGVQTLTNKTAVDLTINSGGTFKDTLGNIYFAFRAALASAVNYLGVHHSVAGTAPKFVSAGADTNIDMDNEPKGAGKFTVRGVEVLTVNQTTNKFITLAAGENISAGDLLEIIDNKFYKAKGIGRLYSMEQDPLIFSSVGLTECNKTADIKVVIQANTTPWTVIQLTYSAATRLWTAGSPIAVTGTTLIQGYPNLEYITGNKFVLSYSVAVGDNNAYIRSFDFDGAAVTNVGAQVQTYAGTVNAGTSKILRVSTTKLLVINPASEASVTSLQARIATVSGTTFTLGTAFVVDATSAVYANIRVVLTSASSATLAYERSNVVYLVQLSFAATTVTKGTAIASGITGGSFTLAVVETNIIALILIGSTDVTSILYTIAALVITSIKTAILRGAGFDPNGAQYTYAELINGAVVAIDDQRNFFQASSFSSTDLKVSRFVDEVGAQDLDNNIQVASLTLTSDGNMTYAYIDGSGDLQLLTFAYLPYAEAIAQATVLSGANVTGKMV